MSLINLDVYVGDSLVKWEPYKYNDCVVNRFTFDEWLKIASDIYSEEELDSLLTNHPNVIQGFVLYETRTLQPIAFSYLLREDKRGQVVSIHGGGWGQSMCLSLLYYRGLILMIHYLLGQGKRVRTSCLLNNTRAYRFLESVGFVKYRTSEEYVYMWINRDRLHRSRISNYLKIDFI